MRHVFYFDGITFRYLSAYLIRIMTRSAGKQIIDLPYPDKSVQIDYPGGMEGDVGLAENPDQEPDMGCKRQQVPAPTALLCALGT